MRTQRRREKGGPTYTNDDSEAIICVVFQNRGVFGTKAGAAARKSTTLTHREIAELARSPFVITALKFICKKKKKKKKNTERRCRNVHDSRPHFRPNSRVSRR
ncbi:hypothetical protein PUN28_012660 [Cardiocondyla obscurior]|uniref:Uncharacterized protein n=1 Tax=Cardiocondyla obscurior TaxID=286306 RepID=A0AAW2FH07_9HYME